MNELTRLLQRERDKERSELERSREGMGQEIGEGLKDRKRAKEREICKKNEEREAWREKEMRREIRDEERVREGERGGGQSSKRKKEK